MKIKGNIYINTGSIERNLKRILNQVYKLLPTREEGHDWQKPLETLIEQLGGMSRLLTDYHDNLFTILCKLQGLYTLEDSTDFADYRRAIFDCITLISELEHEISRCNEETS